MRKILLLALVAPLFVACETGGGTGVSPASANQGNPDRALRAAQPGSGQNASGGTTARVTGDMGEGRPTIEYSNPTGRGVGCPPGTVPVAMPTTREGRPEVACR